VAASDPSLRQRIIADAMRRGGRVVSPSALDRGYWSGWSPVRQVATKPGIDRPINILPTGERVPDGADPQIPVWGNTNCPPWICPPFWSQPVDLTFDVCLPFYEQAEQVGCFTVPQDYVLVIRNISYEALNAEIYDMFQLEFLVNGANRFTIEDMLIDNTSPNPAHRYALGGHTRPIQTFLPVDRNHTLCVRGILKGQTDFNGNSAHQPGDPITTGDCTLRVILQGWLANLRENIDGSPRPTDLGNMGGLSPEDTQENGGYP